MLHRKILQKKAEELKVKINGELVKTCRDGDLSAAKKYIERGANIRAWDDWPLRCAALYGHLDIVKYLVERESNIHAGRDAALRLAAYHGHLEVVKYLVEQGANIHEWNDYVLRCAVDKGHLQVVNVIRKAVGDKYKCHRCIIKSTCLELCEDFRNGH